MAEAVNNFTVNLDELRNGLAAATDLASLQRLIPSQPFTLPVEMALLFLGFICLFLVDEAKGRVCLVSVSDTEHYHTAVEGYNFKPQDYHVDLTNSDSTIVQAINNEEPVSTRDWASLTRPESSSEAARINQASGGITYSVVYPLTGKVRGALMYNFFQYQGTIGEDQQAFMDAYTQLVSERLDELQA